MKIVNISLITFILLTPFLKHVATYIYENGLF